MTSNVHSHPQAERRVLLFTKPSVPGRVKTRLIGELTPRQSAALHGAFLADLLARLRRGAFGLQVAWALEAGEAPPKVGIPAVIQRGGDLGERLFSALDDASRECPTVAAIGSDAPELEVATVERAFRLLENGADAVLGPCADGGYYLIALSRRAVDRRLFEGVSWSTEDVFQQTLDRCRRLDLTVATLPTGHDVDVVADLDALARRLEERRSFCPRTRRLLVSLGRLRETEAANADETQRPASASDADPVGAEETAAEGGAG
ncbi:MAG: TIGR04282 family arsenosugar biosynthesis glycosyltransferase [Acidobacteriota bacterium]